VTEYILVSDATSTMKGFVYAQKGDTVKLVADHGRALIVENEKGLRFPITSKHLIDYSNGMEPTVHNKSDHLEKEPDKKLRRKKGDNIHGSDLLPAVLTLF